MTATHFFNKLGSALSSTAAVVTMGVVALVAAPIVVVHHMDQRKQRKHEKTKVDGVDGGYGDFAAALGKTQSASRKSLKRQQSGVKDSVSENVQNEQAEQENKNEAGLGEDAVGNEKQVARGSRLASVVTRVSDLVSAVSEKARGSEKVVVYGAPTAAERELRRQRTEEILRRELSVTLK